MRAWAEMFDAFLSTWDARAPTPRPTPTPTTSPTSTASRATTACATCSRRAASGCPTATRPTRPTPNTVCGLGNRKNDAFNVVLARDGVTPYPGSVALLDALRELGMPLAVVSSSANAPAVLDAAGLADRFVTVVDGRVATALGLAGKPAPDTFVHAATECGTTPGPLGRRRGRRLGGPRRGRRRVRPGHRRRPRRRRRDADRGRGHPRRRPTSETSREAPARSSADPLDRSRFPVDPWRLVECDPDRSDLGVTETLFTVAQRLHRDARQPRGGARTRSSTAPTSTGCTRPGRSGTPRRPTGSPAPARPSSTPRTPS